MRKTLLILMAALMLMLAACSPAKPDPDTSSTAPVSESEAPDVSSTVSEGQSESAQVDTDKGAFDEYARPRIVSGRTLRVAHMVEVLETGAAERTSNQMQIEAAHRGWDLYINNYGSADRFADAFRKMIADDYDAIILHSVNSIAANKELVLEARNAGIGIYCNDTQVVPGCIGASAMPNGVGSLSFAANVSQLPVPYSR